MPKCVYAFHEGANDLNDLLGGKGTNLAEMTNLTLPVPPGFTITTEARSVYLDAQGEDVVAGIRNAVPWPTWRSSTNIHTTSCGAS